MQSGNDEEIECSPEDRDLVATVSQSWDESPHWIYPSQNGSGPLVLHKPAWSEHPPSNGADGPSHSHTDQKSGEDHKPTEDPGSHRFINCHSHHTSNNLRGNVGDVQKGLPGHEFRYCDSFNSSLSISGSMNLEVVNVILKSRDSMKNDSAADRNAAGKD